MAKGKETTVTPVIKTDWTKRQDRFVVFNKDPKKRYRFVSPDKIEIYRAEGWKVELVCENEPKGINVPYSHKGGGGEFICSGGMVLMSVPLEHIKQRDKYLEDFNRARANAPVQQHEDFVKTVAAETGQNVFVPTEQSSVTKRGVQEI